MSDDQTSEVTLPTDGVSETAEVHIDDGGSSINIEEEPKETGADEQPLEEPKVDYEEKFANSTKENQKIMAENKKLQADFEANDTRLRELEEEKNTLDEQLKTDDPEAYDAFKVKKELHEIKKDLITSKEENSLNGFLMDNPNAKEQKEVLRQLGRTNPNQSYDDLWETVVKPLQDAGVAAYQAKQAEKVNAQTEKGGGAMETSPGGTDMSKFNGLPLAEQKKIIDKMSSGELNI